MYFILPLSETKNSNIGIPTVVHNLSKMIRIIPIKSNITAPEVAMKFNEHVYRNHRSSTTISALIGGKTDTIAKTEVELPVSVEVNE